MGIMNALLPLPKPSASQTYGSDASREYSLERNVRQEFQNKSGQGNTQIGENEIDKI